MQAMRLFLAVVTLSLIPGALSAGGSSPLVRLYVVNCGYIHISDVSSYHLKPDEVTTTDMAVPCYVIRHGRTWVMFDTGLGDDRAGRADRIMTMTLEVPERLAPQLARIGIAPGDIDFVAISHFHYDHVGNLAALPNATLLLQRAEAARMAAHPYAFTPPAAIARLAAPRVTLLDGDYDLFGDGSVVLLKTAGHTAGHQSMLVKLRRTGPVVLTGDLYHYPAERALHRIPAFDADQAATAASRQRIERIAASEHAQIWILHDLEHFRTQRQAPQYYD